MLTFGKFTEVGWSWVPGDPIFLSPNGVLTQTVPELPAAFLLQVALPFTAVDVFFNPKSPIVL